MKKVVDTLAWPATIDGGPEHRSVIEFRNRRSKVTSCLDKVLAVLQDSYGYVLENVSDETKEQIKIRCNVEPAPTPEEIALAIHLDFLLKRAKQILARKGIVLTDAQLKDLKKELGQTLSVRSAIKKIFPDLEFDL